MPKASDAVIDFGDIDDSGGAKVRVPEGDYPVKIMAVKFATSQSGNPMFVWTFKGKEGKLKGKELTDYTALTKKALWKLRDLMEAAIGKAPGGKVNTRKLLEHCKKNVVGKDVGVTLQDDEYTNDKGKTFISSKIDDYVSMEDLNADPPEDEEDEDIEEEDENGLEEMSRAELKKHIKDEELDITIKKSMSDDDIRTAIAELTEDEDEDEDDEEGDEDEDDGLDEMSRSELKAHIKSESLDITVKKSMLDDDIRSAIREAGDDEEEIEDVDLDEL